MSALDDLIELLDLETLKPDVFRGTSRNQGFPQVFGGQVVAQALVAAGRTTPDDRPPHSLHAYFLRPGDADQPIIYEVDRTRDGGSFTTRRVQALQRGVPIFSMMASFHKREPGWDHQSEMPAVPPAGQLRSGSELHQEWLQGRGPESPGLLGLQVVAEQAGIEFRPVPVNETVAGATPSSQQLWFRAAGTVTGSFLLHACVLAYASDFNFLGTAKLAHGGFFGQTDVMTASVDHAIWFHRDLRIDDWLLYSMDSPSAHAARGFVRGEVFDSSGRLVASVAQEGLMRHVADAGRALRDTRTG